MYFSAFCFYFFSTCFFNFQDLFWRCGGQCFTTFSRDLPPWTKRKLVSGEHTKLSNAISDSRLQLLRIRHRVLVGAVTGGLVFLGSLVLLFPSHFWSIQKQIPHSVLFSFLFFYNFRGLPHTSISVVKNRHFQNEYGIWTYNILFSSNTFV